MKTRLKNRWFTAVIAALMILTCVNMVYAEKLRVGVDTAFVPFEFKGKDGKYTGFDVELWKAIAKRLNLDYKLIPMDFNGLIPGLTPATLMSFWPPSSSNLRGKRRSTSPIPIFGPV